MNHVVIGSGFSALGAVLGLANTKKKKVIVINSDSKNLEFLNKESEIKLISRDFKKYKKEINSSYKINRIITSKKSNFISYLGPGGLSTIWGKVLNTEITEKKKNIDLIKKKLKLKNQKKIYNNKNFELFQNYESNLNPLEILKKFERNRIIKIVNQNYIEKITYNTKIKKFEIFPYKKEIIYANKLYLASGFFSNIRFVKNLIEKNNFYQSIKVNHNNMLYGFFINKKNLFLHRKYIKEFLFLDKEHKYFSGKIVNLTNNCIKKYNLNIIWYLILSLFNFLGYNIFLFNFFYKKKNKTKIFFKKDNMIIKSTKTEKNKKYLNLFKKKYDKYFKIKFIYSIKTLTGSDFHYTANIKENKKKIKKNEMLKNLYILGGSNVSKNYFFPTFYFILNSFFTIKNNVNFLKLNKIT